MSELTECNYCSLQDRKWRAKRQGKRVTLKPAKDGGLDVYVHHRNRPPKDSERVGWYMELSDHCVC